MIDVVHEEIAIDLREYDPKCDQGLVFTSWLKSYRQSEFARCMRTSLYFDEHRRVLMRLMGDTQIICAVDPLDPTHVYGWACLEIGAHVPVLHYVFVKPAFRGFGIAKRLLRQIEGRPFFYSHITHTIKRERLGGMYVPHLAFKGAA